VSVPWRLLVLLLATTLVPLVHPKKLESVSDKELLRLISAEKNVITLFSKENCKSCLELEHELALARETLVDDLGAWVVKAMSSPLVKSYDPTLEPAVVFFRNRVPLLYHGPPTEEDLVNKLSRALEPAVVNLTDDNFEHLTQASTGATTGDWLVMFYKESCQKSQRYFALWEAVGLELKGRLNVARVNREGNGGATARRFDIPLETCPAIVLFRHGKLYHYELDSLTVQNFIDFATDFYRNSRAISVPPPKSPFDDLIEMIVEKLRENPGMVKLGSILTTITLLLGFLIYSKAGGVKPAPKKKIVYVKKKKQPSVSPSTGTEDTETEQETTNKKDE